jgi:hypothetical protein
VKHIPASTSDQFNSSPSSPPGATDAREFLRAVSDRVGPLCILCGRPRNFVCRLTPTDPCRFGAPPAENKRRMIFYPICAAHPLDRSTVIAVEQQLGLHLGIVLDRGER